MDDAGMRDGRAPGFLKRLRGASELRVTFTPQDRDPKTATFRLDSLGELLPRAEARCGTPASTAWK